jgi:hypothetical protein
VRRHSRHGRLLALLPLALAALMWVTAGCAGAKHPPASWLGFRAGTWPGASWRPYAASSPFNQPIPANVHVNPRSRRIVARILSWGQPARLVAGASGTTDDYAHPTYWATTSDPIYRLSPTLPWGRSTIRGMRIRIPTAAQPAGGTDGHMTVVEPDGWEYDFWRVRSKPDGGGTLRFAWGGRLRIDGSGLGGEATASDFGTLAGIIRAPELSAGRIDHALFLVVRCTSRDGSFRAGVQLPHADQGAYVYPAGGGGSRCPEGDADAPPMGARLQLAMSGAQIAALGLPAWKAGILRALARYGGYVGDTGGPGFGVQLESSITYTSFGQPDPLVELGRSVEATGAAAGGVQQYLGRYLFDLADGVDWARYLRVVAPPQR